MAQQPAIIQPLEDLTNFSNAHRHAAVLNAFAGLPADDPRHVQIGEAMNAKARAIQLATFARYDDIPAPANAAFAQLLLDMENRLNQKMDNMENRLNQKVDNMENRLNQKVNNIKDELKLEIRRATRSALKALNGSRSEGAIEYEIIPFNNGEMPDAHLPPLTNLASIAALPASNATDYLRGYGIENPAGTVAQKRRKVAELVGVSADAMRIRFG
ncbi:MUG2-like C-terminal domain-containing protein [Pleurotus pulmonarius]